MKMINILSVAFSITLLVRGCDTEQNAVVCGSAKLNTRVGGNSSLVSPGVWPWMASLQFNGSHVCGGTLIAERFVMSSASCFTRSTNASHWTVIMGRQNQNGSDSTEVSTKVVNITLSSGTGENVAVLQLAVAPNLTNFIQPICVDMGDNTFSANTQCWAAGWGSGAGVSQTLQEIQTSVVSCGNSSSNNSICTSSLNLQEGDQGGPLMCKLGQSWIHAAVLTLQSSIQTSISSSSSSSNTSSSNSTLKTARAQDVQVFTKTSSFASFLTSVVGSFPAKATNSTSSTTSAAANKPPQAASSGAQASSSFCFTVSVLLLALTALKIFQGIN